ncbi:hypothetical protein ACFX1S_007594 [Malus domestica]
MWVCLRENCVIDDATGVEKMNYEDFCHIASVCTEQIGPKCRRFFSLSNFMKFEKDEQGRIAILPFYLYVMRTMGIPDSLSPSPNTSLSTTLIAPPSATRTALSRLSTPAAKLGSCSYPPSFPVSDPNRASRMVQNPPGPTFGDGLSGLKGTGTGLVGSTMQIKSRLEMGSRIWVMHFLTHHVEVKSRCEVYITKNQKMNEKSTWVMHFLTHHVEAKSSLVGSKP